jgi:hypothetical protein
MQPRKSSHDISQPGRGPAEFTDNSPKELEGHAGDPKEAIGVAPGGFQPLSNVEDVDGVELIDKVPEDLEQLETGPPLPSGSEI